MEKILTYDNYLLESYAEQVFEGISLSTFKDILINSKKELATNFKFITTFGVTITLFCPLVENLIKNMNVKVDITPTNILLATIGAVSVVLDNNKEKLKWILEKLKDNQWNEIINELSEVLKNIKKLFTIIAEESGKVIRSFTDMLSYSLLFFPFLKGIIDFTSSNKVTLNDFSGMSVSIGSGMALIAGKNIVEWLLKKINKNNN